ncbi:MAG: 50S ribosomal protein L9 [Candidatus Cloacimonetes bacterium HGW-Cloacimonetes-2]|jgi:large subunit ribosomal protein L9|nr:MAG: 50S ribosomal protein L9 [Candidatus Cloacimonetes bacterium HGW-Cloacimonetes-2]
MKVILLENIEKVGSKGELINVKRGFARNYLIPRNYAIYATPQNMKKLSAIQANLAAEEEKRVAELKNLAEKLNSLSLVFARKVDENEHMFGSVSENDIINELKAQGFDLNRAQILMEKHIKELGEISVPVKLHKDITASLKITVNKED